ncbi:unnamed protein product [Nesidiocoris tenuis]|uniref:Uncharacterized protein n=1 Tax=Nesidiocoris tenuis TaxID=355587 RepID=A0A6H5GKP5_9HEMI|nr:unnamed protein product [Nesidiocoris tenuis]
MSQIRPISYCPLSPPTPPSSSLYVNIRRMGRRPRRYHQRGELRQAGPGDGLTGRLRLVDDRHHLPPVLPGHQLPDRHQHVHRRHLGKLLAGDRRCARRPDGRRLRHVLRNLAAVRSGRHAVHPLRPAVRIPGRARASAPDTQAQQIQDRLDGHSYLQGRPHVLRRHPGRPDEGLLRPQRQPDRRDCRTRRSRAWPARRSRLRARIVDAVAPARGILRPAHTERLAQAQAGPPGRRAGLAGIARRPRHRRARREERPQGRHTLAIAVDDVAPRRRLNKATSPIPNDIATADAIVARGPPVNRRLVVAPDSWRSSSYSLIHATTLSAHASPSTRQQNNRPTVGYRLRRNINVVCPYRTADPYVSSTSAGDETKRQLSIIYVMHTTYNFYKINLIHNEKKKYFVMRLFCDK